MDLSDRQKRMLRAGKFHFDSARGNFQNMQDASELERAGLITIRVNQYTQHATYDCAVTDQGRTALETTNA